MTPHVRPRSRPRRDRSLPRRALPHATAALTGEAQNIVVPSVWNFFRGATPARLMRWGGEENKKGGSHEEPIDGRGNRRFARCGGSSLRSGLYGRGPGRGGRAGRPIRLRRRAAV